MVSFFRYSLVVSLPRTFARYVLKSNGTVLFCLMSWPPHLGGDVRYGPIVFLLFCWSPLFRFNLAQRRRRCQQPEPAQADLHVDNRAVLLAMPPFPPRRARPVPTASSSARAAGTPSRERMSRIVIARNSSRECPSCSIAASLTARNRSVSESKTHIGSGLASSSKRYCSSESRGRQGGPSSATHAESPRDASSTSRTFHARASGVKGFCSKAIPGSSTPWFTIASSV